MSVLRYNTMTAKLYRKLIEYSKNKYPYHMPGHKFGRGFKLNKIPLLALDATEVPCLDNLYNPKGILKLAMLDMARYYGSKRCIFLTNGSTSGIIAAILTGFKSQDKVLIARNSHQSVINALILADAIPIYISPKILKCDIPGQIDPKAIEKILTKHSDIKGAVITSPTYEGVISDIKEIRKILGNRILIVDEAHGAHLKLLKISSSINLGADIVISSMHKTLPTLTQSALIHICTNRLKYSDINENLKMIQTSSPSYLLLGLMDYARAYMELNQKSIAKKYFIPLLKFRQKLIQQLKKLSLFNLKHFQDYSKVVILTNNYISGKNLANILDKKYNIRVEAFFQTHVILITSPADTKKGFNILFSALKYIDSNLTTAKLKNKNENSFNFQFTRPSLISLGKIKSAPRILVRLDLAEGNLAAQNIILFPPGIPVICIGEYITIDQINFIQNNLQNVTGLVFKNGIPYIASSLSKI